jgi:hypothetical protein
MTIALRLLSLALTYLVSLVSLRMAVKGLFANEWLRFHGEAAKADWRSLPPRLQWLFLFMVRVIGLGFLALFLLLITVPTLLHWHPDRLLGLACLGIGIVYCVGLGVLNRWLHRMAGVGTPWRGSFAAAAVLALAAALSLLSG